MSDVKNSYTNKKKNGKFELRLTHYWDEFKPAWLLKGEVWFIYPEKNINQKIHEEDYNFPMGFSLEESTQIFTYTDDPDEEGSNLFSIMTKLTSTFWMINIK